MIKRFSIGEYTFEEIKPIYDKFAVRCIQTNDKKKVVLVVKKQQDY